MATIAVKSKNQVGVGRKPRVYFTCHPADFDKYFEKVCADIFATHDCAIYYTEDMTEEIPVENREVDLGRNNLFVVPVTFKLLTQPNRAMDVDIPYAMEKHIPILPLLMEPGIDAFYAEKFGERQYLNPYSLDLTEVPYKQKLKNHLNAILFSTELMERIRSAFNAKVFLSYRKKDRYQANRLMKLIHSYPEFLDVAIWYDEFLTPGESFAENIDKELKECELFLLLVTPKLMEKVEGRYNFVKREEYPAARRMDKQIVPIQMKKTNRHRLKKIFVRIPKCVDPWNAASKERLLEAMRQIASGEDNAPEHNYLIGLAYLEGIDVEVNRDRAVELITSAAEAGLPEAMEKLYTMYRFGDGIHQSYSEAKRWVEKLYQYMVSQCGKEHTDTIKYLDIIAILCWHLGEYGNAVDYAFDAYKQRKTSNQEDTRTFNVLLEIDDALAKERGYAEKASLYRRIYEILCEIRGENDSVAEDILRRTILAYERAYDYSNTVKFAEKLHALQCVKYGSKDVRTLRTKETMMYLYFKLEEYEKMATCCEEVHAIHSELLGEKHPTTLWSLHLVAMSYSKMGENEKSLTLYEKIYAMECEVQGKGHVDTCAVLEMLNEVRAKLQSE